MKNVRIFLASFLLLAIASAFITPKSHVNPVTTPMKTQVCVDNELVWDGGNISGADFQLGITASTELNIAANWASGFQAWNTLTTCSGTPRICKIRIKYCYDPAPPFNQSDPLPTGNSMQIAQSIQDVIDKVALNYTASGNPSFFPLVMGVYEFTFVKNGITITIQVITKS